MQDHLRLLAAATLIAALSACASAPRNLYTSAGEVCTPEQIAAMPGVCRSKGEWRSYEASWNEGTRNMQRDAKARQNTGTEPRDAGTSE